MTNETPQSHPSEEALAEDPSVTKEAFSEVETRLEQQVENSEEKEPARDLDDL